MKFASRLGIAAMIVTTLCAVARPAAAYNYHVFWFYNYNFYNSFAAITPNELYSDYSDDNTSFITLEQWRQDGGGSGDNWSEIGFIDGDLNSQYYNGVFGAYNELNGYSEFPIASGVTRANTTLSVDSNNSTIVNYLYNGYAYATVTTSYPYANQMQVGMESNGGYSSFNGFQTGVDASAYQVYAGGSSWIYWPSLASGYYNDSPGGSVSSNYGYDAYSQPHAYWYN
jgi:hypothetical protein